jgi:hypothetical protein
MRKESTRPVARHICKLRSSSCTEDPWKFEYACCNSGRWGWDPSPPNSGFNTNEREDGCDCPLAVSNGPKGLQWTHQSKKHRCLLDSNASSLELVIDSPWSFITLRAWPLESNDATLGMRSMHSKPMCHTLPMLHIQVHIGNPFHQGPSPH